MSKVSTRKPYKIDYDDNNIYYNIKMTNDGSKGGLFGQAVYSVNRTSAILENPSDYELSVVRFSIPASNIPIMVWNGKEDRFKIVMEYDGYEYTSTLTFIPNSSGNDFYGDTIWNYQEMINMINNSLQECFNNVKANKPLAPPTLPPFMSYNANTKLCSFNAPIAYYNINPNNTIKIYFNIALYKLFPSLQSFEQEEFEPKSHRILIQNLLTNTQTIGGNNYFIMLQEYSTLALWSDLTNIIFETDHIPVASEYQPTRTNNTRRVITDFEPLEDINNRERFQYFGLGFKRFYDLKSTQPLSTIDMRAYWEDGDGNVYPIYIGDDEFLSMKILFRKKNEGFTQYQEYDYDD